MHQSMAYYQDTGDWQKRVHLLPDGESWRQGWPNRWRDDLVITPAGIYIVRQEDNYSYARPATQDDAAAFFAAAPPGEKRHGGLILPRKMPCTLLRAAAKFFLVVWQGQQREDVLILYLNDETRRYALQHPKLKSASAGHVDYEVPKTPVGWTNFGSFHSHGHERAYHSGMDAIDDLASPGLHVMIGSLAKGWPTLYCIFSHSGHCFGVPASDVFTDDQASQVKFPEYWLVENVPAGPRPARWQSATLPAATAGQVSTLPEGDNPNVQGTNQRDLAGCPVRSKPPASSHWVGWD